MISQKNGLTLSVQLKSVPRNHSHGVSRNGRPYKTSECKKFEQELSRALALYNQSKQLFRNDYDDKKHGIKLALTIYTPKLYTQRKTINKKSVDFDAHKVLVDVLFNWLGIDDSQIIDSRVIKKFGLKHSFTVSIDKLNFTIPAD